MDSLCRLFLGRTKVRLSTKFIFQPFVNRIDQAITIALHKHLNSLVTEWPEIVVSLPFVSLRIQDTSKHVLENTWGQQSNMRVSFLLHSYTLAGSKTTAWRAGHICCTLSVWTPNPRRLDVLFVRNMSPHSIAHCKWFAFSNWLQSAFLPRGNVIISRLEWRPRKRERSCITLHYLPPQTCPFKLECLAALCQNQQGEVYWCIQWLWVVLFWWKQSFNHENKVLTMTWKVLKMVWNI